MNLLLNLWLFSVIGNEKGGKLLLVVFFFPFFVLFFSIFTNLRPERSELITRFLPCFLTNFREGRNERIAQFFFNVFLNLRPENIDVTAR